MRLKKQNRLTDKEYELMKNIRQSRDILKDIKMLDGLSNGTLYHHERFDGSGYPSGLKGDEIPLIARIISVADTYDAMTSTRCYRKGMGQETAGGHVPGRKSGAAIHHHAGTAYRPQPGYTGRGGYQGSAEEVSGRRPYLFFQSSGGC